MKRKNRRCITDPEPTMLRSLRLSHETIRTLGASELSQAVAGCDTTSLTTERRTHTC